MSNAFLDHAQSLIDCYHRVIGLSILELYYRKGAADGQLLVSDIYILYTEVQFAKIQYLSLIAKCLVK